MKAVYLYGTLEDEFGPGPHFVEANTLPEITSYFDVNFGHKFKPMIRSMMVGVYVGKVEDDVTIAMEQANWRIHAEEIHIMPEAVGKKQGGLFKAILGVALIGIGLFMGFATPLAIAGMNLGITYGSLALMGVGLVLSAFATPPKTNNNEQEDEKNSSMYAGAINTQEQGGIVPIVYGRKVRVGGVIIHSALDIEDLPADFTGENLDPPVVITVGG